MVVTGATSNVVEGLVTDKALSNKKGEDTGIYASESVGEALLDVGGDAVAGAGEAIAGEGASILVIETVDGEE